MSDESDFELVTRSGKVLTEADIQALADEAEEGYDVSHLKERFVVLRAADFRRMTQPRAMNYATAETHADEWNTLVITDAIVTMRAELILEQAADQMYLWAISGNVWMDCPDLDCKNAIFLGATPNLEQIKEAAREHVREAHGGGPIVLHIEPEGPVHDSERGGTVVDDPPS